MVNENQKIKDGVKNNFDTVAKSYDTNRHFKISAAKMVALIEKPDNPLHILDLSTGTGHIAIELAKKYPNAKIYGVDISDEMLNIARQKCQVEGLANITFHQQDVENLDFEGMKFDIVTCGYGLFFYPDMDGVYRDVLSRLSDDGVFIFSTFKESAFQPYITMFLDILDTDYGIRPPQSIENRQLNTKKEICELVGDKELVINDIEIRFPMAIDEWWELLNTTGYQSLLAQLGERYELFELKYKKELTIISKEGNIDFNTDSFITIVKS